MYLLLKTVIFQLAILLFGGYLNIGCQTMAYRCTNFWIGLTLHRLDIINSVYIYTYAIYIYVLYINNVSNIKNEYSHTIMNFKKPGFLQPKSCQICPESLPSAECFIAYFTYRCDSWPWSPVVTHEELSGMILQPNIIWYMSTI